MPRDAYVNGRYVRHAAAAIHIEDRGYQFADGVYEVIAIAGGAFVDAAGHLARLRYSLGELRIAMPLSERALTQVMTRLARRNGVRDGLLYIQITRGAAPRDFRFPTAPKSAVVMTTRRNRSAALVAAPAGVSVVTLPDQRWARPDIKTTGLLAQVLAKQAAVESGAFEAWMVDREGFITEGASSNAWIVTADGVLVTRQPDRSILHGVTGNTIEHLARRLQIRMERRPFSLAEAYAASEAFLTSATTFCLPIIRIDGREVGDGKPGPIAARLRSAYLAYAEALPDHPVPWTQ
jgi:D-alanine transaminase